MSLPWRFALVPVAWGVRLVGPDGELVGLDDSSLNTEDFARLLDDGDFTDVAAPVPPPRPRGRRPSASRQSASAARAGAQDAALARALQAETDSDAAIARALYEEEDRAARLANDHALAAALQAELDAAASPTARRGGGAEGSRFDLEDLFGRADAPRGPARAPRGPVRAPARAVPEDATYEQLLALDDGIVRRGVPPAQLRRLVPTVVAPAAPRTRRADANAAATAAAEPTSCVVCMDDSTPMTSRLPCGHVFHAPCISTWLREHTTCPVCRRDVASDG